MQFRASGHSIGRHVLLASTSLSTGNDTSDISDTSEDEACGPACQTTFTGSRIHEATQDNSQLSQLADVIGRFLQSNLLRADRMEERMEKMEERMEARMDRMDAKFERMDAKFERMDAKLEGMEERMEAKFKRMEAKLEAMEGRMEAKLERMDEEVRSKRGW